MASIIAWLLTVAPATASTLTGRLLPANWPRNSSVLASARNVLSISESLSPRVTAFTVPSSFSSTVTSNLPVRPLACTVLPSAAGAAGSSAGTGSSSTMPWLRFQALFTASITPLLLTVAPATVSMLSAATLPAVPMNCARNRALSLTWPRKGASISLLASPTSIPVTAAFSSTEIVTSKVPVRPLPWAVKVSAPSGMDTSGTSASAAAWAA